MGEGFVRFAFVENEQRIRQATRNIQGFLKGRQLLATSPGPKNAMVKDSFSLRGFNAAYAAIVKACPAGKAGA